MNTAMLSNVHIACGFADLRNERQAGCLASHCCRQPEIMRLGLFASKVQFAKEYLALLLWTPRLCI